MTTVATDPLAARIAAALAEAFPGTGRLHVLPGSAPEHVAEEATAVAATFVGQRSAEFGLVLVDGPAILAEAAGEGITVTAADVLRPALEAGARELGTGVLSDLREVGAASVFHEKDVQIVELRTDDALVGWFAVALRAAVPAPSTAALGDRLSRINNVAMELTVEIGRTRMSVRDVLGLEPGAVIELDRSIGAPADILLNGRLIAHGEVVVVDQDYAVRVTRILDPDEATR